MASLSILSGIIPYIISGVQIMGKHCKHVYYCQPQVYYCRPQVVYCNPQPTCNSNQPKPQTEKPKSSAPYDEVVLSANATDMVAKSLGSAEDFSKALGINFFENRGDEGFKEWKAENQFKEVYSCGGKLIIIKDNGEAWLRDLQTEVKQFDSYEAKVAAHNRGWTQQQTVPEIYKKQIDNLKVTVASKAVIATDKEADSMIDPFADDTRTDLEKFLDTAEGVLLVRHQDISIFQELKKEMIEKSAKTEALDPTKQRILEDLIELTRDQKLIEEFQKRINAQENKPLTEA